MPDVIITTIEEILAGAPVAHRCTFWAKLMSNVERIFS